MQSNDNISFENLLTEVVEKNLCNKCGGCVSFCSANGISALEIGENGFPKFTDKEKCLECGICYLICPQTRRLDEELKSQFNWKEQIGNWTDIYTAQTTDNEILKNATDGGVVTSLLVYLLENGIIDGAIVSGRSGFCGRKSIIAQSRNELIQAAGLSFTEMPNLNKLGDVYPSYFPIIKLLKGSFSKKVKKLAIVGTPCQINAIRKMQLLNIVPSNLIIFTIGLFCMQCFTLQDLVKKDFAKKHKIEMDSIQSLNIKDDLILKMKSNINIHVPLEEIEELARPACLECKDFSNEFADISVGGIGSPEGFTTVMIRSTLGKQVYSEALNQGYLKNRFKNNSNSSKTNEDYLLDMIKKFTHKKIERVDKNKN